MTLHSTFEMDLHSKHLQRAMAVRHPNIAFPLPFAQLPNLPRGHLPMRLPFPLPLHLPLFNPLPPTPAMLAMASRESLEKPVTSFSISDILNGTIGRRKSHKSSGSDDDTPAAKRRRDDISDDDVTAAETRFNVRSAKDLLESRANDVITHRLRRSVTPNDDDDVTQGNDATEEIDVCDETPTRSSDAAKSSPLDALFKMTSKTFESVGAGGILNVGKLKTHVCTKIK